jgi:DNA-binding SARP family transcriptional activator
VQLTELRQGDEPGDAGMQGTAGSAGGRRGEVVVRVLGPVDVVGAARPFDRAWTLDLVVYLAMHRRGASVDEWATALWPDCLPAAPTRHSTVSAARRALGRSETGPDHLPHSRGVLRLGPTATSDWDQFRALAEGPGTGPASWEAALGLVRGRPFDGLRSYDWTVLEGLATLVEDAVVQLCLRLAGFHLEAGDGRAAELAARRGLLVSPFDERLYRSILHASDLQGNPAGIEAAMAQLVHLVAGGRATAQHGRRPAWSDPSSLRWVHPETASLYRSLSRRHTGARVDRPVPHGR